MDNVADAHREAQCIALDLADARRTKRSGDQLKHVRNARGRAHQLIHMLNAAEDDLTNRTAAELGWPRP